MLDKPLEAITVCLAGLFWLVVIVLVVVYFEH